MKTALRFLSFISILTLSLVFASCSHDEDEATAPTGPTKPLLGGTRHFIDAVTETGTLKTSLQEAENGFYNVVWSKGDAISVTNRFNVTNNYVLSSGEGTSVGNFGSIGTFTDYSKNDWPYGAHVFYGITSSDNFQTLEWPSQQNYNERNSVPFYPMYATFDTKDMTAASTPSFKFQNLGGLLRLQLRGNATIGRIKVMADQPLAGEFELYAASDDANKKKAKLITGDESKLKYSVTLNCGSGITLNPDSYTYFFVALPEGVYSGVRFDFYDTNDNLITYLRLNEALTLNIQRSKYFSVAMNLGTPNNEVDLNIFSTSNDGDTPRKVFFSKVNFGATYSNPIGTPQPWPGYAAVWTSPLEGNWYVPDETIMTRLFRNTMLAPKYWYSTAGETGSSWAWADDKANMEYTWKQHHEADGIQYVTVTSLFTGKYIDIPVTGQQSTPTKFWVIGNGEQPYTGISFGFQIIDAQNKQITTSISRTTPRNSEGTSNLLYIRPVRLGEALTNVPTKDGQQYVSGGWSEIHPDVTFDTPNGSVCDNALRQK